ncbi:MAG: GerMN domain-containing protein [Candidatus Eisenbacteria bacterium]|uniref:GerMN domain-containing protein n=1 Tax=Eiseniibacteriota bacterium TaxID=2212470 RepID=A0A948RWI9_UNCEI|nr:GerMN domain-containing protein [Candidatus Eisenbacteria bacterium]MBU1951170.1 GerMN domain-containing protein [Candidatus Eisenbacteria bacterium]MBU2691791.1 GerMN domain-containing protein [Candidatus Eisenbacteria bacterium]
MNLSKTSGNKRKDGTLWGWIPILLLVLMGLGGTYLLLFGGDEEVSESFVEESTDALNTPTLHPVLLYFGAPHDPSLRTETHWIAARETTEERIVDLVESLILGSHLENVSSIPPETAVLGVFLDGLGGAYLNFSESLRTLHPHGDGMEWLTIRSIVGTVTQNIPEVERVWVLIDGEQEKPLVDNIPLDRYYSWADINS